MTNKDLLIIQKLLERTENLPEILHLRAAPLGYELTDRDKELLFDTYQKLDDILKEVAAFINIKFPGRADHIESWNEIDFDTKIGGFKILTTDREHTKSAWRKGMYDLKSLIKTLINEVVLLVEDPQEMNIQNTSKESIINSGNMIINHHSKVDKQKISTGENDQKESNWSKANVIIALVVGLATIGGILWQIFR